MLARHIGKHIPGNPTIVPQNMTGAGSLRAAQFLYNAAPKDGLTFATFSRMAAITPLLDSKVLFDATKFTWLGSVTNDVTTCLTWHTSPVKTWKDFTEKPSVFGGARAERGARHLRQPATRTCSAPTCGSPPAIRAPATCCWRSSAARSTALCGLAWTLAEGPARQLDRREEDQCAGPERIPKQKPTSPACRRSCDLTSDPEKQQILKMFVATHDFARPFAAPPGIPDDRKAALIAAFDATMKDPEFLAEAKQRDWRSNRSAPRR